MGCDAMTHPANISYRVGRKLTLQNGPSFVNDAIRNLRKPYII